jgi:hypothetical protein
MRVPPVVENPFRIHYRGLILASALRIAEAERDRLSSGGQVRRAHRAEHAAETLRALTGAPSPQLLPAPATDRWFGPSLRRLVRLVWVAAAAFLLVDVVSFGLHSWATTGGDVAVILLTALWFGVAIDDLIRVPELEPQQLELFESQPPAHGRSR